MSTHSIEQPPEPIRQSREAANALLFERLAQAGHLASECGLHEQAEQIFCNLVTARPGVPSPSIALAIVRSCGGKTAQAIDDIRRVRVDHPDNEMAIAVLGMFLAQAREPEADDLFRDLLARGTDPAAIEVARLCMKDATPAASEPAPDSLEYFRHFNIRP